MFTGKRRTNGKWCAAPHVLALFFFALCCLAACAPAEKSYTVVCWGDSLTWGAGGGATNYPSVLEGLLQKNVNEEIYVANAGVGGESSATICARAGVYDPLALAADAVLPAGGGRTKVVLNYPVLRQGGREELDPCTLGGIEGKLTIEQRSYTAEEYTHYFEPSVKLQEDVPLTAGTELVTRHATAFDGCFPVVFIGQNGGWEDSGELIAQQRALIGAESLAAGRYLVLGLTSGSAASRAELEGAMEEAFGERYVNLRAYLSGKGLADAGITPTEEDEAQMAEGVVPESLRSDGVHLNADGYRLIGNIVYDTMRRLGFTAAWES